jgi:Family of unknown function (DUF5996)
VSGLIECRSGTCWNQSVSQSVAGEPAHEGHPDLGAPPDNDFDRGEVDSLRLADGLSAAAFYERLFALLAGLGIEVEIKAEPFGVPVTTPFAEDTEHASYGRERRAAPGLRHLGGLRGLVPAEDGGG